MKRVALFTLIALACAGIARATFHTNSAPEASLAEFVPAGPSVYLEAKDFSSLLKDWESSKQKQLWIQSDNYEVFSRSRLFLRLKSAGEQFAIAAGFPPDTDLLSQIAGEHSVLALYDVGKLQFLYITYLPSARSMETKLWQTRAKFEPRKAGTADFYLRRDPESQREVAFAISGDYLLLATREDLIAAALDLMAGKQGRALEGESWWASATAAAGQPGDLRLLLDMKILVPNGYFRTYWVQQNITDLSQYSAAVSDLYRSGREYREERVLIRGKEPTHASTPGGMAAVGDLSRLVPNAAGEYVATANPTNDACYELLTTKILAPHSGRAPASLFAPQIQLTSGTQGDSRDLETRIDQASAATSGGSSGTELKDLLMQNPVLASLQFQSSRTEAVGVFVRLHSTIVLTSSSDWNEPAVKSAIVAFVAPELTASQLGVVWVQKSGYLQLDGLWPLSVSVRGKYLVVSDDSSGMESVLAKFSNTPNIKPLEFYAGFNHDQVRPDFARFASMVDHPGGAGLSNREPQFFSGNVGGLSSALADVSSEHVEVRSEPTAVRQTVIYEWAQ
ncbi:MAG TPA: hypothetical protein VGG04_01730 [Candidatus Sulfotelmatobacter sp.]